MRVSMPVVSLFLQPKLPTLRHFIAIRKGITRLHNLIRMMFEYAGLVKFDFLGLRTLTTIINWALEMINARRAKNHLSLLIYQPFH